MRGSDVQFTVNSGKAKGKSYGYTLATEGGRKLWTVNPTFLQPPSMYNEIIEMSIFAGSYNVGLTGAVELREVGKILNELRAIGDASEPTTLIGLDGVERIVRIPRDGYQQVTTLKEAKRDSEYHIKLTCWGMYKYGEYDKE